MSLIRNLFALVGLAALVVAGYLYIAAQGILQEFDPKATEVLSEFASKFVKTDMATAAVVRMPLADGVSIDDAVDSMKLRANMRNIKLVGEKPLHKQIEATTGTPYRYVGIFEFCDAGTAVDMLEYNFDYVAFMPCRIALFEDPQGKTWLATMNMDLLIHGGKELAPGLKEKALKVRDGLLDIMQAGANGEL